MLIFLLPFFPPKAGRLHKSSCRVPLTALLVLELWLGILSSLTRSVTAVFHCWRFSASAHVLLLIQGVTCWNGPIFQLCERLTLTSQGFTLVTL